MPPLRVHHDRSGLGGPKQPQECSTVVEPAAWGAGLQTKPMSGERRCVEVLRIVPVRRRPLHGPRERIHALPPNGACRFARPASWADVYCSTGVEKAVPVSRAVNPAMPCCCIPGRTGAGVRPAPRHALTRLPAGRAALGGGGSELRQPSLSPADLKQGRVPRSQLSAARGPGCLPGQGRARLGMAEGVTGRGYPAHEKTACSFIGALYLAATIDWLRR